MRYLHIRREKYEVTVLTPADSRVERSGIAVCNAGATSQPSRDVSAGAGPGIFTHRSTLAAYTITGEHNTRIITAGKYLHLLKAFMSI